MFTKLKFILKIFILFFISFTIVRWGFIFILTGISLPFLLLFKIVRTNFHNITPDFYSTPFPLVFMNPSFANLYKFYRLILIVLADFLGFIFFVYYFRKITFSNFKYNAVTTLFKRLNFFHLQFWKKVFVGLVLIILITIPLWQFFISPLWELYSSSKKVIFLARESVSFLKNQDFTQTELRLKSIKEELEKEQVTMQRFSWLGSIPFLKNYYFDLQNGLSAGGYTVDSGLLALTLLPDLSLQSMEDIDLFIPPINGIMTNYAKAFQKINTIDPNRYPSRIGNIIIRENIILLKENASFIENYRKKMQPSLHLLPKFLGVKQPRVYLILFQNENELRPTGGFITSLGAFRVEKGKITPEGSDDIYTLDQTIFSFEKPPDFIQRNLLLPVFYLHDANSSPDFYVSMKNFEKIYQNSYQKVPYDGILAIDGEFIVRLLKVLGPTSVGDVILSAENNSLCRCPDVISKISDFAQNRRKDIIGIMLNGLLLKFFSAPASTWPAISMSILESVKEKDLLFYFVDPKEQQFVEVFGGAGRIRAYEGDYLHINEANFGQPREDMYVKRRVDDYSDSDKNGNTLKTLMLTYQKLPSSSQLSLLTIRFYVNSGAKLIEAKGFSNKPITTKDLDKTVFETHVELKPNEEKRMTLKYSLPISLDLENGYSILRQKQPGVKEYEQVFYVGEEKKADFFLDGDKEFVIH